MSQNLEFASSSPSLASLPVFSESVGASGSIPLFPYSERHERVPVEEFVTNDAERIKSVAENIAERVQNDPNLLGDQAVERLQQNRETLEAAIDAIESTQSAAEQDERDNDSVPSISNGTDSDDGGIKSLAEFFDESANDEDANTEEWTRGFQ